MIKVLLDWRAIEMWRVSAANLPRALVTPTPSGVLQPFLIRAVVLANDLDNLYVRPASLM
jgi:hypothetical protein